MNLMQKGALLAVFLTAGCGTHKPMVAEHSSETLSRQMPVDYNRVTTSSTKEFLMFGPSQKNVLDHIVGQTGVYRLFDIKTNRTAMVLAESREYASGHGIFRSGGSATYVFLESYEPVDAKPEWEQRFETLDKREGGFYIEKVAETMTGISDISAGKQGLQKVLVPSENKECQILLSWDRYAGQRWDTEFGADTNERDFLKGTCKTVNVKAVLETPKP